MLNTMDVPKDLVVRDGRFLIDILRLVVVVASTKSRIVSMPW